MPNPSTLTDESGPSAARRTPDALTTFLRSSISQFVLASLLVLAVVGLLAGLLLLLLWSLVPH